MPQLYMLIILGSIIAPELLDPAGLPAAVLLDGADRRGARRVPARPQPRLRARRPRARRVATAPSCARHILPNALVATLSFLPFTLSGSVTVLASLDFLGFGLPPGSPSLGELVSPGQEQPAGALARHHRVRRAGRPADPADLHRRGGARRLRPAPADPGMDASARGRRPVGRASARRVVERRVASRSTAARPWRWSARAARASR